GTPFFVEQFGRWILATGGHGEMPDLGDVILGRLEALGPGARAVAELAAVAGTHLDIPNLLGLAGSADATLIYRMRESGLLRTVVTRPNSVEPYHDRIRDIVCESIPVRERGTLHRRIADH